MKTGLKFLRRGGRMNLPDKLSELTLVALEYLEECEADPKYEINMDYWYVPNKGKCKVCFVGAVMANQAPKEMLKGEIDPDFFEEQNKLEALEEIRRGWISDALKLFYGKSAAYSDLPFSYVNVEANEYPALADMSQRNRTKWKLYMQDIAGILAEEGL